MKKNIWLYGVAFAIAAGAGAAIFALFADISEKKAEAKQYPLLLSELSDDKPHFDDWGKNFPQQLSDWRAMEHNTTEPTEFGGSLPYSKIIRYRRLPLCGRVIPLAWISTKNAATGTTRLIRWKPCATTRNI